MAGGTWTTQNKTRPGVYINISSEAKPLGTIGDRGIVAYPAPLPWGNPGLIVLDADTYSEKSLSLIGFRPEDPTIQHITAAMAHARRVLIYRLGGTGAVKAKATEGNLTATAKWGGLRGNDLKIVIQANIDKAGAFDVYTYLGADQVDKQTAATVEELINSEFVDFTGEGAITATAGLPLKGGTEGTSTGGEYSEAFKRFETEEFNVLGLPTDDQAVKQLAVSYINRLRNEGKKVTAVLYNYPQADSEGISSLKNSIVTSNGQTVPAIYILWEIAAMEAAANMNESLTYRTIPGAVDVSPKYTNSEIEQALLKGELVLSAADGRAYIEQDINTFTSYTPTKGAQFSKNRVVRVLDSLANDIKRIFEQFYIGKVDNNADGRNLLRGEINNYLTTLQTMNAIQNFDAQNDVTVLQGNSGDSVYVELSIQPVDAIEKIYMRVKVK